MAEDLNAEIATALNESKGAHTQPAKSRWEDLRRDTGSALARGRRRRDRVEWLPSGQWDGRQAELYGEASTIRIDADQQLTLGGQQRLLDVTTFNTWIEARS